MTSESAVLFDVDGTLVDSNYLHVTAWFQAFLQVGSPVTQWRIHRAIGMGSGQLVSHLLGEQRAGEVLEEVTTAHSDRYREAFDLLRPFPAARELVAAVADRGAKAVLATSASPEELKALLATLDLGDTLAVVTSSKDAEAAKPEPDIVQVALREAGVPPERAIFVGDTTWDAEAAAKAGLRTVALRSGGIGADELRGAGAVAVYDDPRHLLDGLDDSPLGRLLR
jgi:HAD superfamily hydrolase (TIGR01509 family)